MNCRLLSIALTAWFLTGSGALAASTPQPDKKTAQAPAPQAAPKAQPDDDDEVFTAHCGRCHVPPMTISQRTTGTVIMHMRARARLSRQDELRLLRFMAP